MSMVYRIYVSGYGDIYDTTISNMSEGLKKLVINPKLKMELNDPGTFEFTLAPSSGAYNAIKVFSTTVDVLENDVIIWTGRCIEIEQDMNRNKHFRCQGALSYFKDIVLPYKEYASSENDFVTISSFFKSVVSRYNHEVSLEGRKFSVKNIILNADDQIWRKTDYETAWDVLEDMLLNAEGGYLLISKDAVGDTKVNISYIEDFDLYNVRCSQTIEFGKNLNDITHGRNAENIVTDIVPVCHYSNETYTLVDFDKENTDTAKKYQAALNGSANVRPNRAGVLVNHKLRDKYGRVEKVVEYDMLENLESLTSLEEKEKDGSITNEQKVELAKKRANNKNIVRKTKAYMFKNAKKKAKNLEYATFSITAKAADLRNLLTQGGTEHVESPERVIIQEDGFVVYDGVGNGMWEDKIDPTIDVPSGTSMTGGSDNFVIGQLVKVVSAPHGLNENLPIYSVNIDLTSGLKDITIGIPKAKELTKILKPNKNNSTKSWKKDNNKHVTNKKKSKGDDEELPEIVFTQTHADLDGPYHISDSVDIQEFKVGLLLADGSTKDVTEHCTFTMGDTNNPIDGYTFETRDPVVMVAHYDYEYTILNGSGESENNGNENTTTLNLTASTTLTVTNSYIVRIGFVRTYTDTYQYGDHIDLSNYELWGEYSDKTRITIANNDPDVSFNPGDGHEISAKTPSELTARFLGDRTGGIELTATAKIKKFGSDYAPGEADADGNQLAFTYVHNPYTKDDLFYKSRYEVTLYTKQNYAYARKVTDACDFSIPEGYKFEGDASKDPTQVIASYRIGNHSISTLPAPIEILSARDPGEAGANGNLLRFSATQVNWKVGTYFDHTKFPCEFYYEAEGKWYDVTDQPSTHYNIPDTYKFTGEEDADHLYVQAWRNDQNEGIRTQKVHILVIPEGGTEALNGNRLEFISTQVNWAKGTAFDHHAFPTQFWYEAMGKYYEVTDDPATHYQSSDGQLKDGYIFKGDGTDPTDVYAWRNEQNQTLETQKVSITVLDIANTGQNGELLRFKSTRVNYTAGDVFVHTDFPVEMITNNGTIDVTNDSATHYVSTDKQLYEGYVFKGDGTDPTEVYAWRNIQNQAVKTETVHLTIIPKLPGGEPSPSDYRIEFTNTRTNYTQGDVFMKSDFTVMWYTPRGDAYDVTQDSATHWASTDGKLYDGYVFKGDGTDPKDVYAWRNAENRAVSTVSVNLTVIPKGTPGQDSPSGYRIWFTKSRTNYTSQDVFHRADFTVMWATPSGDTSEITLDSSCHFNIEEGYVFKGDGTDPTVVYAWRNAENKAITTSELALTILSKAPQSPNNDALEIRTNVTRVYVDQTFNRNDFPVYKIDGTDGTETNVTATAMYNLPDNYVFTKADAAKGTMYIKAWWNIENVAVYAQPVSIQVLETYAPGVADPSTNDRVEFKQTHGAWHVDEAFSLDGYRLEYWYEAQGQWYDVTHSDATRYSIPIGYRFKESDNGIRLVGTYGRGNHGISDDTVITVLPATPTGQADEDDNRLEITTMYNPWYVGQAFDHAKLVVTWWDKNGDGHDVTNDSSTRYSIKDGYVFTGNTSEDPKFIKVSRQQGNHTISDQKTIRVLEAFAPGAKDDDDNTLKFTKTHGAWGVREKLSLTDYEVTWYNRYGDGKVVTGSCEFNPSAGYQFAESGNPDYLEAIYRIGNHTISAKTRLTVDPSIVVQTVYPNGTSDDEGRHLAFTRVYGLQYAPGDHFDLSKYTVTFFESDGTPVTVTGSCTYNIGGEPTIIGGVVVNPGTNNPNAYVFTGHDPDMLYATYQAHGNTYWVGTPLNAVEADELGRYIRFTQRPYYQVMAYTPLRDLRNGAGTTNSGIPIKYVITYHDENGNNTDVTKSATWIYSGTKEHDFFTQYFTNPHYNSTAWPVIMPGGNVLKARYNTGDSMLYASTTLDIGMNIQAFTLDEAAAQLASTWNGSIGYVYVPFDFVLKYSTKEVINVARDSYGFYHDGTIRMSTVYADSIDTIASGIQPYCGGVYVLLYRAE